MTDPSPQPHHDNRHDSRRDSRISVELVPRDRGSLEHELCTLKAGFPDIDTVNVPDLLRFNLRSWEACACAKRHIAHAIPHLRAIDIDLKRPLPMTPVLESFDIREVLVVTGDAPADMSRTVHNTSSLQLIRKLHAELPGIRVYAALDPYRQSFVQERDYALQKLEAGACGLFTQPFFDVRLMAVYAELLPATDIFWGVTSVLSKRSLSYWQNRNRAIVPAHFESSLKWSQQLARDALAFARARGDNLYLMPIRTDAASYLAGVLPRRVDVQGVA